MLGYCKKCGRTMFDIFKLPDKCDICNSTIYEVPREYIDDFCWRDGEQVRIEELVKTSSEFDPYLFEHRDEILSQENAKFEAAMEHGRAIMEGRDKGNPYGVVCPYCNAANVKKISMAVG